jgi:hypothetical protein
MLQQPFSKTARWKSTVHSSFSQSLLEDAMQVKQADLRVTVGIPCLAKSIQRLHFLGVSAKFFGCPLPFSRWTRF